MKKKITFIFCLFYMISYSQNKSPITDELDAKIVKTFKTEYVEQHFEDPYIFDLVKITKTPVSVESYLISCFISEYLTKLNVKKRTSALDAMLNTVSLMSSEEKNKVAYYVVKLDCYQASPCGGKVLGRYTFEFYTLYYNSGYYGKINVTKLNGALIK